LGEFFDQSPRQQDDPAIRERERPHLGAVEALLLPAPRRVASVDALRGCERSDVPFENHGP
jgi:hypothetical protein